MLVNVGTVLIALLAGRGFALSRTTAGRMAATTYLVPPVAVLLGWLLLAETPPSLAVPGGLLCLIGAWLARRADRGRPRRRFTSRASRAGVPSMPGLR